MTRKRRKISALIAPSHGQQMDAHYLAYFDCFNRQLFFEAHAALEELWLAQKASPNQTFHKGLIQLAGAFVHLQKSRLRPAAALFRLAEANLAQYPAVHERLDVSRVLKLIRDWLGRLEETQFKTNPLAVNQAPNLGLQSGF